MAANSVKAITARSIYYACQLYDGTGQPAAATPCTLRFEGNVFGTRKTVTQSFVYTPNILLIGNNFTKGTFSSAFALVTNVTISVEPKLQQPLTVIDLDSFNYTAYFK